MMPPKSACLAACLTYVQTRLDAARAGMAAAQESSNSETKSSAGDKYETGRAMAQQERDRHAAQLHEAQQLLATLQKINPELASDAVRTGTLAATSLGLFYVSISAGRRGGYLQRQAGAGRSGKLNNRLDPGRQRAVCSGMETTLRQLANLPAPRTTTLQNVARCLLGSFMVTAGTGHLTFVRQDFQAQVPDFVPMSKDTVVLLSGVVEIGLGLALLFLKGKNRVRMGLGLAAFYAAIFPGNIHQYTQHLSAFGLDTDGKRLARLFGQPVLIGVALWSTGALKALRKK
jgi:uncharacterized membrane protein